VRTGRLKPKTEETTVAADTETTAQARPKKKGTFERVNPGPKVLKSLKAQRDSLESVGAGREGGESAEGGTVPRRLPLLPRPLLQPLSPMPPRRLGPPRPGEGDDVRLAGGGAALASRSVLAPTPYVHDDAREELVRESRALYRRSLRLLREAEGLVRYGKGAPVVEAEMVKARASALQATAGVAKQVQGFAELLARLEGLLRTGNTTNIAVAYVQSPEWRRLKAAILGALEPYPDALEAVGRALEGWA
jgi:hypothetical protein